MFNHEDDIRLKRLEEDYEAHLRELFSRTAKDEMVTERKVETTGLDGLLYGFNPDVYMSSQASERVIFRGELSKKILPFIRDTLKEHDHKRKPIDGGKAIDIDLRVLCELVDKAMQRAALEIDAVKEIMMEPKGGAWDRRDLLYGIFEEVTSKELGL